MANTYLTRTPSSTGNRQIFTFSAWVKRSKVSTVYNTLFYAGANSGTSGTIAFRFTNNYNLNVYIQDINQLITTNRVFRDTSAWYHIVLAIDTTQATPDDRRKLYINGVQETSFSTSTEVNRNLNLSVNTSGQLQRIGTYSDSGGSLGGYFDGSMSHVHLIDGTAYDATAFGEFDANGVWKIKTSPSVTYGTNGFFILKDGNSVTDQSGNGNNWTVGGGTLTNTEDNPSNVFATWNSNLAMNSTMTLANSNTTGTTGSNYASGASNSWFSTIGVSSGKWYAEFKESAATNSQGQILGVGYDLSKHQQGSAVDAYNLAYIAEGWGYLGAEGRVVNNNNTVITGLSTWNIGDTICIALDMDNHKLYFRKNGGSWENSGDPTSGSTGTGAISLTTGETYFFSCSDNSMSNTYTFQANFGNGFFGTTAVASAGTNASGIGIFEYDVPTGFTALSTKGLNL